MADLYPIRTRRGREGDGFVIHAYDADIDQSAYELVTGLATTYAQLAAEDTFQAVSSDAADTSQTCYISYVNSSGKYVSEGIALNGATAVDSVGTGRYVDQNWVDIECAGTISVQRKTGPALINSIEIGQLRGDVAHHFNGQYNTYLQRWSAENVGGGNTIIFQLRWYPDDADCLDPTDGYHVLDRIALPAAVGSSAERVWSADPNSGLRLPAGGWLAVYAIGGAADQSGSVSIVGFDDLN